MRQFYVFIKCELGHANDVAADMVDNVEYVSEVYSTSGQYDLLAKFQLPKDLDIGTFVTKSVQTRANIRDTFTFTLRALGGVDTRPWWSWSGSLTPSTLAWWRAKSLPRRTAPP